MLALTIVATSANAQLRTFQAPRHGGYAISYCGAEATSCGEVVATAWCRSQGYDHAQEWAARTEPTAVGLDDGRVCRSGQCDAFATITCGGEAASAELPMLPVAAARSTVLAPNLRQTEVAYDPIEFGVLIPGCHQTEPGTFLCETVHEYQHCRTLMRSGRVLSCRAGLAFDGGFAEPVPAEAGHYELSVDSSAGVRVEQGMRGTGKIRGDVDVEVLFEVPEVPFTSWCLQRDRYVYHTTGPSGGLADVDDTADCEEPVEATFAPHEDDLLVAYDLCEAFDAWGGELEHSIDVIVAALYQIGSASPRFRARYGGATTIIAPYLTVKAPLRIDCHD